MADVQVIGSHIDKGSSEYASNRDAMLAAVENIGELHRSLPTVGGDRRVTRHRDRGKMLVRERIEALIDSDIPFLELTPLAGWNTDDSLGARAVTGIGIVSGVETVINGSDLTVKGGTA
ncbi:MAG: acyl-CoA carboxylase subunit beta, partial [bacterium]|nr:acyl-CoA carboxylase subunit beta [bacterium]